MDHSGMDHSGMGRPTTTGTAAAASATGMSSMEGMGNGCKISMLWNWYTVDSCFIASTWRVTSAGAFAGSCIGVILLVMSLEFLRRAVKEYDRYLVGKHAAAHGRASPDSGSGHQPGKDGASVAVVGAPFAGYRPTLLEQVVRALLHMVQFAVAYFIMLLAMYYNGYIIISIFIGAFLGSFVFQWETLGVGRQTSAASEATVCCG